MADVTIDVLLVEDDAELAGSLSDFLTENGFDVDFAFDGHGCLSLIENNQYDVIVMDVTMPSLDGLETCRIIREEKKLDMPIIFLTARDTLSDKSEGFAAGGDDYLVKPFAPQELTWRLQALVKRGRNTQINKQQLGELEIDHELGQVYRQGQLIDLHDLQFRLLNILIEAAPKPVSRAVLEKELWPEELPDSDPLRTHIYRLRQQLDRPFDRDLIQTEYGKGYRVVIAE